MASNWTLHNAQLILRMCTPWSTLGFWWNVWFAWGLWRAHDTENRLYPYGVCTPHKGCLRLHSTSLCAEFTFLAYSYMDRTLPDVQPHNSMSWCALEKETNQKKLTDMVFWSQQKLERIVNLNKTDLLEYIFFFWQKSTSDAKMISARILLAGFL